MKLNYAVLGTNDMEASVVFYDALFAQSDVGQTMPTDRMHYWVWPDFAFAVAIPFDGKRASNGNGTMVGLDVGSSDEVTRMHAKAIELGGTCEGAPNPRGPFFSAYVRDLDRNKLCFSSSA